MKPDDDINDLELARALRRLAQASEPPPIDPAREAALLAAFDAASAAGLRVRRPYWGLASLAAAATVLMVFGLAPVRTGRHGFLSDGVPALHKPLPSTARGVRFDVAPSEFVMVPGASALPPLESGSLVRIDVPVSMLPSLGLTPPPTQATAVVRADLIVGQDGLTRAVRLVN